MKSSGAGHSKVRSAGSVAIPTAGDAGRRGTSGASLLDIALNGADGLERMTLITSAHVFSVPREKFTAVLGRVSLARRGQIGRTLVQAFRLPP